jgi:hypothetical protein
MLSGTGGDDPGIDVYYLSRRGKRVAKRPGFLSSRFDEAALARPRGRLCDC